ncbi:endonuclease/exonuclease/phosphatase family protein [Bifidobacterium simiarum]|uniref:Endonuclease n=1 Tax=Bifidobacterium simiarum TaxID=2045441 RepID=A0A2M9HGY9_9BIFI|nr:endonuclease/exonuclease/phosphatase family protein [Bifidobacterium simiarum]PJM76082.1 endonuclease [Bifidobacterium simiarum]
MHGRGVIAVGREHGIRRVLCGALAYVLALIALVGIVCRLLPSEWSMLPYVPVIIAATPWFALVAAVALLLALLGRHRAIAALMVASLALQAFWQAPFFTNIFDKGSSSTSSASSTSAASGSSSASSSGIRVMTCNVYKGNADAEQIVSLVRSEGVQVLALQETTKDFVSRLEKAGLGQYLPYSQTAYADGVYGNGLWSSTPLVGAVKDEVNSSASQMPSGTVTVKGMNRSLRFVSVHTTAPVADYWSLWKRSLDEIALLRSRSSVTSGSVTYVFMGDFNSTYDHAPFRNILGDRFADAARQEGRGFTFSWPANRPGVPLLFAIDHIVIDRSLRSEGLTVHRISGTDHAALIDTLYVK